MGRPCYAARACGKHGGNSPDNGDGQLTKSGSLHSLPSLNSLRHQKSDEDGHEMPFVHTRARTMVHSFLVSPFMELATVSAILASMVCIVIETDRAALEKTPLPELEVVNAVVLGIYSVEAALRLFVFRAPFFTCPWNLFDCFVLLADYTMLILESFATGTSFAFLRVLRLLRMARSARVLKLMPQLWFMVRGMIATVKIVFCGVLLLGIFMLVIGVLAVQILHPVNRRVSEKGIYDGCDRCPRAFESTANAMLTFTQQIITGDSWGTVSMPIIEEEPATAIFFILVFVLIALMVMNIILSMVVEASLKAADEDKRQVIREKERAYKEHASKVKAMCAEIDEDKSGQLSKQELIKGFETNHEFEQMMKLMELSVEELNEVFNMLDTECTGNVAYEELAKQLYKMKTHDSRTTLSLVKHYVTEVRDMMKVFVEEEFCQVREALFLPKHAAQPPDAGEARERPPERGEEPSVRDAVLDIRRSLQAVMDEYLRKTDGAWTPPSCERVEPPERSLGVGWSGDEAGGPADDLYLVLAQELDSRHVGGCGGGGARNEAPLAVEDAGGGRYCAPEMVFLSCLGEQQQTHSL